MSRAMLSIALHLAQAAGGAQQNAAAQGSEEPKFPVAVLA
jgi:hypothetical protein